MAIPKRNNSKHHVCHRCYKILSGQEEQKQKQPATLDLPKAYLKRVEALKNKESASPTSNSSNPSRAKAVPEHLKNLEKADREIAERLEKLKEDRKPKEKVTDKDISARLAGLKGQTFVPETKPLYKPPDRRLQPEQVEDLLEEIASEVEIDSHRPNPAQEVEARLARLRSVDSPTPSKQTGDPSNDLNQVSNDKSQLYKKNIGFTDDSNTEETNLADIERLMVTAAQETEDEAKRATEELMRDEKVMERLREIQKKNEEKKATGSSSDQSVDNSNVDESDVDDEDSDEETKKILARYLAEAQLEQKLERDGFADASNTESDKKQTSASFKPATSEEFGDDDELPFCCICEEDASVRCVDCEMDIFCQRCYRECHVEIEVTDHRTVPYRVPKGYS